MANDREIQMTLSETEWNMILEALEAKQKHCIKAFNAPRNTWNACSLQKKEEWHWKAESYSELESKIANELN